MADNDEPENRYALPLDPKVAVGGDAGEPIVAAEPKSAVTEAYLKIAEEIVRQLGA